MPGALKCAQEAASAKKSLPVIKMELVKMAVYLTSGDQTASNVMRIVWKIGHLKRLPNAMKPMGNVYMAVKVVTTDYNVLTDVTVIAERIRLLTFRFVTKKMEHATLAANMNTVLDHNATDTVGTCVQKVHVTETALAGIVDLIIPDQDATWLAHTAALIINHPVVIKTEHVKKAV